MSNIFVRIIGEFKDKEFKRAQKATFGLTKQFDGLRRSARRAFLTVAGVAALKRSVQAFAEEDAAVQKLSKSLDNLGLRFESGGVDQYLENLEKATAVTKEQLYPAFQQLANTTLSVTKSQELLNAALDISAGTGKDLGQVVVALSRAFNGNFTSLGKLQTSYTTAQLEAMGFNEAVTALNEQFTGSAATAANTYEGKIKKMNIAFNDAAEAIGEGVVDALEALGGGNYDKGLEKIVAAGEGIANAFRSASKFLMVTKFALTGGLFKSRKEIEAFALAVNSAFAPPDAAKQRTFMRERSKYLQSERKQTEKIRKDREKAAKLLEKDKNNQKLIANAQKTFDMEQIQIQAALKGKISEEERTRLLLMKAINEENGEEAKKLLEDLDRIQKQTLAIKSSLSSLKASNPFANWEEYTKQAGVLIAGLEAQLAAIYQRANDFLKIEKGVGAGSISGGGSVISGGGGGEGGGGGTTAASAAAAADEAAAAAAAASAAAAAAVAEAEKAVSAATTQEEAAAAGAFLEAAKAAASAAVVENEAAAALEEFVAFVETQIAQALEAEATAAALLSSENMNNVISAIAAGESGAIGAALLGNITVNVTVEGSVTTQDDLVEAITDGLYYQQKTGKGLLFSSVAI